VTRVSRRLLLLLAAPCLALAAGAALAQSQELGLARASAVKAAFLYKFGTFVEWPPGAFESAAAPLVIGVYGDEAVAADLEQVTAGREVDGHPVRVRRIREFDDLPRLHILFAGGARESRVREVLAAARGPVLTVSDGSSGERLGAVLYFVQQEGRVRFGASPEAATARGLRLSAKLLAVAFEVEGR
jgi:hypothetical protein